MVNRTVVSFLGWSNTGKTTFIERALKELIARGRPCAALKCTRHPGSFHLPGKDSTRFFQTGAESAMVGGPETILALRSPDSLDGAFLDRLFPEAQIILIEGGYVEGALRVLAAGAATEESELKLPLEDVDAILTNDPDLTAAAETKGVRCLSPDDIEEFLKLVEENHGT